MVVFLLLAAALGAGYLAWRERRAEQDAIQSLWLVTVRGGGGPHATVIDARGETDEIRRQILELLESKDILPASRPGGQEDVLSVTFGPVPASKVARAERSGKEPAKSSVLIETAPERLRRTAGGEYYYSESGRRMQFGSFQEAAREFAGYLAARLQAMDKARKQAVRPKESP